MTTINTNPSTENGNSTAIIVLALVVLAAIVIGAVYFMNGGYTSSTTSNTTDRTITRVQEVPAQVGQAVDNAADTVTTPPPANATPPSNTEPAPVPAQ